MSRSFDPSSSWGDRIGLDSLDDDVFTAFAPALRVTKEDNNGYSFPSPPVAVATVAGINAEESSTNPLSLFVAGQNTAGFDLLVTRSWCISCQIQLAALLNECLEEWLGSITFHTVLCHLSRWNSNTQFIHIVLYNWGGQDTTAEEQPGIRVEALLEGIRATMATWSPVPSIPLTQKLLMEHITSSWIVRLAHREYILYAKARCGNGCCPRFHLFLRSSWICKQQ